jgi:hypothetical protein
MSKPLVATQLAKLVNYINDKWSVGPFVFFVGVWT